MIRESVNVRATGYLIGGTVHLNADQLALALYAAGHRDAARIVERFRDEIGKCYERAPWWIRMGMRW